MQKSKGLPPASSALWGTVFPTKASKGDKKKLEIVEMAIELFSKNGIESVTYDEIAARLNTNRSHITYHFKERRDLYLATFRFMMVMGQEFTVTQMREIPERSALFKSYLQGYFGFFEANPQYRVLMLFFNYLASIDSETQELYREMTRIGWQRIREILREYYDLADKKVPKDLDLQTTAVQKFIVGTLLTSLSHGHSLTASESNPISSSDAQSNSESPEGIDIGFVLDSVQRVTKLQF